MAVLSLRSSSASVSERPIGFRTRPLPPAPCLACHWAIASKKSSEAVRTRWSCSIASNMPWKASVPFLVRSL